jgi:hypothetical protein
MMTELNGKSADDLFLNELEAAIRLILCSKKSTRVDKLSAVNAGVKLLAIRHKINGGDDLNKGFFDK